MRLGHQLGEDPEDAALVHNLSELDRLQGLVRVTLPNICFKYWVWGGTKWSATGLG